MSFVPLIESSKHIFGDAYIESHLQKWDMSKAMQFKTFRNTKYYHRMAGSELIMDLLNDSHAQGELKVFLKNREWESLQGQKIIAVDVEPVPCTLTRMDIFDKVAEPDKGADPPIVRRGGRGDLVKRVDEVREGFQVTDNLREMMVCEESENAELYSEEEKAEFLWRVFEHMCLGGPCCQFEDNIEPYLETTKKVYKKLLGVHKNSSTGKVEVVSSAYRLNSITTESGTVSLFPVHSRNSFCYVTVDPLRRMVRLWYHAYIPFW